MLYKNVPAEIKTAAAEKFTEVFGDAKQIDHIPLREYMIKWLSAFAPDMTYSDAKSFCLPRYLFKNYLWHAFSFEKTDCYMDEDAEEYFENGFEGECFVLLNHENVLFTVPDGSAIALDTIKKFDNIIIFTKDFTETFVYTGKEGYGPYYKGKD